MPKTTQAKLRRIATRVTMVLGRHKGKEVWFECFATTVGESAPPFIELYDEVAAMASARRAATGANREATASLVYCMRGWATLVSAHIPTLDRASFGDNPDVIDEVLSDANQLINVVDGHEKTTGVTFDWSATMRSELLAALEAAKLEWGFAGGFEAGYAEKLAQLRAACERFNADLVIFRVAVEQLLGTSHPDYQKLRTARARTVDVDDDPNAPAIENDAADSAADENVG